MSVPLHYRYYGTEGKPPMIIIHGLMGSSKNWNNIAQQLASDFEVFSLDMRNHGDSAHEESMSYTEMADDLHAFITDKQIDPALILGHSMGGKVAMKYACSYPDTVSGLIAADIVPKNNGIRYKQEIGALCELDLTKLESRKHADELLQEAIPNKAMRSFLMTSLARNENGSYYWKTNIKSILNSLPALCDTPLDTEDSFYGPCLFMRGEHSDFVIEADRPNIAWHFKHYTLQTIPNSGHNVHIDNKDYLCELVYEFARNDLKCWL